MRKIKSLFFVIVLVLYAKNLDAVNFGLKFKGGSGYVFEELAYVFSYPEYEIYNLQRKNIGLVPIISGCVEFSLSKDIGAELGVSYWRKTFPSISYSAQRKLEEIDYYYSQTLKPTLEDLSISGSVKSKFFLGKTTPYIGIGYGYHRIKHEREDVILCLPDTLLYKGGGEPSEDGIVDSVGTIVTHKNKFGLKITGGVNYAIQNHLLLIVESAYNIILIREEGISDITRAKDFKFLTLWIGLGYYF